MQAKIDCHSRRHMDYHRHTYSISVHIIGVGNKKVSGTEKLWKIIY